MARSHNDLVTHQFSPGAQAYVHSAVHAGGEDLDALEAVARRIGPARALDLGTGGGHVAYRLAPHCGTVIACDLSEAMIAVVAETARARGHANIATCLAAAEALPFEDASFDFCACRFSAHHWHDVEAGLREARRVLKPRATAIFIDVVAPDDAACDTHLQAVELLRDGSHVRDHTQGQWREALTRAGFGETAVTLRRLRMDYADWVERMRTPEPHRVAIRSLQSGASREIARHFAIEPDGSFALDTMEVRTTAA